MLKKARRALKKVTAPPPNPDFWPRFRHLSWRDALRRKVATLLGLGPTP